jgi:hypothetical protein
LGCGLFLQKEAVPHFSLAIWRHRKCLLAAEDNLFKEEDMVCPVNLGFANDKDVVKEQFPEALEVVALPVIDSRPEVLDCYLVPGLPLGLLELICEAFGSIGPPLEFTIMWIANR